MRPGRFGRYAIRTADGVQEAAYLPIGGIEQYIRVRGRSRANPVLLVLHGGPGSTLGATACRWQGALEAAFTVVHWDQRGSGNTYYRDPAAPPPTVERLLSDLDELVDALRARYGRDRLFLLGHSWGSLLGGLYALRRPEKLSAWLPVSQMVDFKRSEQVSAAEAIRRARGAGREEDAERLYEKFEGILYQMVAEYSVPIPGVVDTVQQLRKQGLKIGSTTGYTSQMMKQVLPKARGLGYEADCVVTPDVTGASRPTPFMLYECMRRLNVYPPSAVVKVGDTVVDIQEGKNAGAWSIGILTGSNLLGLTQAEYEAMAPDELEQRKQAAAERYLEAGADLVIDSIRELPDAVAEINRRMAEQEAAC